MTEQHEGAAIVHELDDWDTDDLQLRALLDRASAHIEFIKTEAEAERSGPSPTRGQIIDAIIEVRDKYPRDHRDADSEEVADAVIALLPSVHLPTRKQVEDARDTAWQKRWDERVPLIGPLFADEHAGFIAGFDAAVALFSQPSPSTPNDEDRDAWYAAVQAKRAEQRAKGYTAEHDREHGVEHLLAWAQDYASRGRHLDAAALVEAAREVLLWKRTVKSDYDVIDEQYRGVTPPPALPETEQ